MGEGMIFFMSKMVWYLLSWHKNQVLAAGLDSVSSFLRVSMTVKARPCFLLCWAGRGIRQSGVTAFSTHWKMRGLGGPATKEKMHLTMVV